MNNAGTVRHIINCISGWNYLTCKLKEADYYKELLSRTDTLVDGKYVLIFPAIDTGTIDDNEDIYDVNNCYIEHSADPIIITKKQYRRMAEHGYMVYLERINQKIRKYLWTHPEIFC